MTIVLLTLVIGGDYRASVQRCLQSKRAYAAKHGYTFIEGDETYWDRNRPIAWSKVPFILAQMKAAPPDTIFWLSDADVLITNPDLRVEDHVLPLLPNEKQVLMSFDSCGHINSGNMFFRNTEWVRNFWIEVWNQTDMIYHIWWENAGIIRLLESRADIVAAVQIAGEHKRFNAYLRGLPDEPLWEAGDFLVHFAGVYEPRQLENLINLIEQGQTPRLEM